MFDISFTITEILNWISQSLRNMCVGFLPVEVEVILNPTLEFPKPEKYAYRIPTYLI
jgi:hypothetical protein